MQDTSSGPPSLLSASATTVFLAGALLVTGAITAGVAALYDARPADPSALLSGEHTPLVVTATRLKNTATAARLPLAHPNRPKSECLSIAC